MFIADDATADLVLRTLILGPLGLLWVLLVVRVVGLRSYSKMTAVDFVVTVAHGSLLASAATATKWTDFAQASGAMAVLLLGQMVFTWLRRRFRIVKALENSPILLMREGKFLDGAMATNRIARADVWAKLRENNVTDMAQVRAVVLETTGDLSVMLGEHTDPALLTGVESGG